MIVVAYHAADRLEQCLAAIYGEFMITVIDNSSSPEVEAVARSVGAEYVDAGANRGFGAGVNLGLGRLTGADADVLLLNPDTLITADSVRELQSFLHRPENSCVGVVSPRLIGRTGVEETLAWPFPSPGRMCAEAVGIRPLPARSRFVVGAVLLLRREAIADVGGFDERFFLYAEEADWQRRARDHGWISAVCAHVVAEHDGAGTSPDAHLREILFHAGQETYIRKWYGTAGWWTYRVAACVGAGVRAVILTRGRRANATRRARHYLRGPCRCAASRPR